MIELTWMRLYLRIYCIGRVLVGWYMSSIAGICVPLQVGHEYPEIQSLDLVIRVYVSVQETVWIRRCSPGKSTDPTDVQSLPPVPRAPSSSRVTSDTIKCVLRRSSALMSI
jgi:hypothetical protein